jgi:uncharacterized protein (TIGR00730 family)
MRYICVFAGLSSGGRPEYRQAAQTLGKQISEAGFGLVYGGAKFGLMGVIADQVLAAGSDVIGVVPPEVKKLEVAHSKVNIIEVSNYAERKQKMADLSVGFVALPGGLGTLDEAYEMMIANQLKSYENSPDDPTKPFCFFNVCRYFDHTLNQITHGVAEGFIKQSFYDLIYASAEAQNIVQYIKEFKGQTEVSTELNKWWEKELGLTSG